MLSPPGSPRTGGPIRWIAAAGAAAVLSGVGTAVESAPLAVEPTRETFTGQATDTVFPEELIITTEDGRHRLRALGSGTRRQLLFKVYECAPYIEVGAPLEPDAAAAMIEPIPFVKHIMLQFVRETAAGKVRDAYERGFAKVLPEMSEELAAEKARLLEYVEGSIPEGETIGLTWIPGNGLYTRIGDRPFLFNPGDELASAIMAIWLGDDPVHPELKRNMLRFVEGP
jgi:hypothetical protein